MPAAARWMAIVTACSTVSTVARIRRPAFRSTLPGAHGTATATARGSRVDENGCPPRSAPLFEESKRSLILEGVFFQTNSAVLTGNSLGVLDRVAASLGDWPEVNVEVGGHTDSSGPTDYNANLSLRRAESVRDYLISRGVARARITVRGYGEAFPIANNATAEGRARNRRVELSKLN